MRFFILLALLFIATPAYTEEAALPPEFATTKLKAEQGDAESQSSLGWMYLSGRGVTQDYEEAVKWYRKAAEQGVAQAQSSLGYMYLSGQGVKQNYEEAVKWYRKAAEQGNASGQRSLGFMYEEGRGVTKDHKEAFNWYRKAAEHGDAIVQDHLGMLYAKGQGVTQNYEEAVKWYRKAAEQGFPFAQYNLGCMYYDGQGVTKDYKRAAEWFRKAAEHGVEKAGHNLGIMYLNGQGVMQNYEEAYFWLMLGSTTGDERAVKAREECRKNLTPSQKDSIQRRAQEWRGPIGKKSISKGPAELSCLNASIQVFDRPPYVKCWDRCAGSYGYGKCPQISDTPGTKPEQFCHGDPGKTICTSWIADWPITYLSVPQAQAFDTSEMPTCLQKRVDEIKIEHVWNPPAQINEYVYKGKTTYLVSSDCCDQFELLYDTECRTICSPSGGFSGGGDGKCSDFSKDATFVRLVWKDKR